MLCHRNVYMSPHWLILMDIKLMVVLCYADDKPMTICSVDYKPMIICYMLIINLWLLM